MDHRPYSELRAKTSPRRRARNEAPASKMLAEILLSEMRQHAGMTQRQLALALGVKQPTLAQMEKQDDIQVSTLRRLVSALGGELDLIVRLPEGEFRISQFSDAS